MKTVRVRIAVSVESDGDWSAFGRCWGGHRFDDREISAEVLANTSTDPTRLVFIEADVPVPEAVTIEGTVQP